MKWVFFVVFLGWLFFGVAFLGLLQIKKVLCINSQCYAV